MAAELVFRFVVGGAVVVAFAVLGDRLNPKSFAGLFGAAPSVALATLGLTLVSKGPAIAGIEGRSMMAGAVALAVYSVIAGRLMRDEHHGALQSAAVAGAGWFAVAGALWALALR